VCNSYSLVLRHTTEEVFNACIEAIEPTRAAQTSHLRDCVMTELAEAMSKHSWFTGFDIVDEPPMEFSLEQWINYAKESQAVVFIAGSFINLKHLHLLILSFFLAPLSYLLGIICLIIKLERGLKDITMCKMSKP